MTTTPLGMVFFALCLFSLITDAILSRRITKERQNLRQLKDKYNIPDEELEVPTWKLPKFIRDKLAKRKEDNEQ